MHTLLINAKTLEKRAAVLENGKLTDLKIQQPAHAAITGSIYAGRVVKVVSGMQAAFVDIGLEKNAYLSAADLPASVSSSKKHDIVSLLHEGEKLFVQVKKEGDEWKGPKVSAKLEFTGTSLVYMPYGNYIAVSKKIEDGKVSGELRALGEALVQNTEGVLYRTAAAMKSTDELKEEWLALKEAGHRLQMDKVNKVPSVVLSADNFIKKLAEEHLFENAEKILYDDHQLQKEITQYLPEHRFEVLEYYTGKEGLFSAFKIEEEIDKLQKRIVWLKNGAYLVIDRTEAMFVIDVNSGKYTGKTSYRETALNVNLEAAREIPRQLRLRNMSGIILIDFIDMKEKSDQEKVLKVIAAELKKDRIHTRMAGLTELNILQLTRKKTEGSLSALLQDHCSVCGGTGRVKGAEALAFQLERLLWEHQYMEEDGMWIEATPDIISLLKGEGGTHLEQLEAALHFRIFLTELKEPAPHFHIRLTGSTEELLTRMKKSN
ncbi:Rne/Rng family ribonuclease [Metabacillus sp. GX 13764]|uniref:Rne/Rng family ribonuclease n=1 Tax=Metabacillus kandeliae TaxID=2900151 RepID=UPI001E4A6548|nr:Rne/Rng family ribonuclease [Metabacillus kandeliae]MCD7032930.1 Rne/Rng family ribonuclease [Metabacillus kandeliae]